MVGLPGKLLNSKIMRKLKMKLLYNEEERFCTKIELLNLNITLPLVTLDMVGLRLVSNDLMFSSDIPVYIQLVTFLLLCSLSELSIGVKSKIF